MAWPASTSLCCSSSHKTRVLSVSENYLIVSEMSSGLTRRVEGCSKTAWSLLMFFKMFIYQRY